MMEIAIEAVWAAQPEDVSLLHVLFYIPSAGTSTCCSTPAAARSRTAS